MGQRKALSDKDIELLIAMYCSKGKLQVVIPEKTDLLQLRNNEI